MGGAGLKGAAFPSGAVPSGEVYLADPFVDERGTLTVFTTSGVSVAVDAGPVQNPGVGRLMVNFTGALTPDSFTATDTINPFVEGNALSAFVSSTGETDVLRVDGQLYLAHWDG